MFHVTSYAGQGTFFTAINYAYEELGKLICLVIKLSKFHFFCSLALCLFNGVAIIRTSFFSTQHGKPQNFSFALSKSFGILSSLLSPHSILANIRSLLLIFQLLISTMDFDKGMSYFSTSTLFFYKLMFSASELHFLQQKLASQHSAFALSTTIFFHATCLRRRL